MTFQWKCINSCIVPKTEISDHENMNVNGLAEEPVSDAVSNAPVIQEEQPQYSGDGEMTECDTIAKQ